MIIRLLKPGKGLTVTYECDLLRREATWVAVRARWGRGLLDLGLLCFEPDDVLVEHFYSDHWYNIYQLYAADGSLKGWYCNITRPALISADELESEDLELDLLVSPDRTQIRLDDEDEFAARDLEIHDPEAYAAALAAVEELRGMIARGEPPFNVEC